MEADKREPWLASSKAKIMGGGLNSSYIWVRRLGCLCVEPKFGGSGWTR